MRAARNGEKSGVLGETQVAEARIYYLRDPDACLDFCPEKQNSPMSLVHQRHPRRDVEDPASREHSVGSEPVELVVAADTPPSALSSSIEFDERAVQALRRKYNSLPRTKRTVTEWIQFITLVGMAAVVAITMGILYSKTAPILDNLRAVTDVIAARKDKLAEVADNILLRANTTAMDAFDRYVDVVNKAGDGIDRTMELLNDPQVKENIQVLTASLTEGKFKEMGALLRVILNVVGALTKSAGDNGVTLSVGNWKAYVNETDVRIND